jgi:hypothetical protein
VIVAIVGGTMLTIVLTRPRLRWVEQLTADSEESRLWLERALTALSFVMGGYAATTLLLALHKQLGAESDALLRGAAGFLFVYAWLVHFEPFAHEWQLRGGLGAVALYTGLICPAITVGGVLAALTLDQHLIWSYVHLILLSAVPAAIGWLTYRFSATLFLQADRLLDGAISRARRLTSEDETT